jgi:fructose-bisphosphate aldolase class I
MNKSEMLETVSKLCSQGKGILAADESTGTIGKRLATINLGNNGYNRLVYRDLLFTTPGLNQYISGVITYEETLLNQELVKPLKHNDIVIGIKLDKGVKPLYHTDELLSQGLDNLDLECKRFYDLGARFARWRSVINIDLEKNYPSDLSLNSNAIVLARYASICQNNGLVPIVEPEILMKGNHTIQDTKVITMKVLQTVFNALESFGVDLSCTILKPNMVRKGDENNESISNSEIAKLTVEALNTAIPNGKLPGVFFLSGGMSEEDATDALNEINKVENNDNYCLSFSYGRALQTSVLQTWLGKEENIEDAQNILLKRARLNSLASIGKLDTLNELPS